MLDYKDLNGEQQTILKNALNITRISMYYLEDHNILLMKASELFEYVFIDDIKKYKEAISFIHELSELNITQGDVNKSVMQILLEKNDKIIKISNDIYAYKES